MFLAFAWGLLKLIFAIFFWIVVQIIQLIGWIIRTTRESRARNLRRELEEANSKRSSVQTNSEEFISGEPDLFENKIDENVQLSEHATVDSIDDETVSPVQREVIKKPKHSRWELIKPDKKEDSENDKDT